MAEHEMQKLWGEILREGRIACGMGPREFAEHIGAKPSRIFEIQQTGIATEHELRLIAVELRKLRESKVQSLVPPELRSERVELLPAGHWDCPDCGAANFARYLVPELSDEERAEMHDEHGIEPWSQGDWMMAPAHVTCRDCNRSYKTLHFRDGDDEIEL